MVYLIIMLIYLPIYTILHVCIYMNLSNQIVPIYVLTENNVDLFYKKCAFISS